MSESTREWILDNRSDIQVDCLFGDAADVWVIIIYVRISDQIYLAGFELVKWVKALRNLVGVVWVLLELGFEGVIWVNEPVLLGGATSPNRTCDLSRALGAVKSLTLWYIFVMSSLLKLRAGFFAARTYEACHIV